MSKRQQAVQFSTVAKVLLVSLFLGGSGVGYVLQKGQILDLKKQKAENEIAIDRLEKELLEWNADLNQTTTRPRIHSYMLSHRLKMQPTDLREVVTMQEPPIPGTRTTVSLVRQ
jgi:hypothetical protein